MVSLIVVLTLNTFLQLNLDIVLLDIDGQTMLEYLY